MKKTGNAALGKEISSHCQEIAERMDRAEKEFVRTLMRFGRIGRAKAERVFAYYRRHKLVKRELWMGEIKVTHGAFLDMDVIRRAATL